MCCVLLPCAAPLSPHWAPINSHNLKTMIWCGSRDGFEFAFGPCKRILEVKTALCCRVSNVRFAPGCHCFNVFHCIYVPRFPAHTPHSCGIGLAHQVVVCILNGLLLWAPVWERPLTSSTGSPLTLFTAKRMSEPTLHAAYTSPCEPFPSRSPNLNASANFGTSAKRRSTRELGPCSAKSAGATASSFRTTVEPGPLSGNCCCGCFSLPPAETSCKGHDAESNLVVRGPTQTH